MALRMCCTLLRIGFSKGGNPSNDTKLHQPSTFESSTSQPQKEYAVCLRNAHQGYGTINSFVVLDGLDMNVPKGAMYVFNISGCNNGMGMLLIEDKTNENRLGWSYQLKALIGEMDWSTGWIIIVIIIGLPLILNLYEFKKLAAAKTTSFRFVKKPITYLLIVNLLILTFPFLIPYRLVVYFILWIKHGRKFGGLMQGPDVPFCLKKECICQLVVIVQYDTKKNTQPFYDFARAKIRDVFVTKFKKDPRSFSTIEKSFGYYYIVKDAVEFDEICRELKTVNTPTGEITKADLIHLMNENINKSMIMDNKVSWEMLIGRQPIKWIEENTNDSKNSYPIVIKERHSTGDGLHFYKAFLAYFGDDIVDDTSDTKSSLTELKKRSKFSIYCYKLFLKMVDYVKLPYIIIVQPATILLNMILLSKEPNILHGPKLSNDKIVYFDAEETPHYIDAIKRIKRRIGDCSFQDVLFAALTASFGDYFKKHAAPVPDYLAIETPVVPEILALQSVLDVESKKVNCYNAVSLHMRKLPLGIVKNGTVADLLQSIKFIKRERRLLARRVEREVFTWSMDVVMPILPVPLIQYFFDNAPGAEATISNLPGPASFTAVGGYPIQDLVPFAGHRASTGVTLTISSYNDRLKYGILVDKVLINKEEDVHHIVNGFYKYIDLLDSETQAPDIVTHL